MYVWSGSHHVLCNLTLHDALPILLSVLCVDGDDEAVAVANGTRYRLAAGVWSRDPVRARSVAARIRAEQEIGRASVGKECRSGWSAEEGQKKGGDEGDMVGAAVKR